jgi:hypothetical protein
LNHSALHGQFAAGGSNVGFTPCWGNFHLDEIVGLTVLAETFAMAQSDFNPDRFLHLIHSI